jgi:hypothetical protein
VRFVDDRGSTWPVCTRPHVRRSGSIVPEAPMCRVGQRPGPVDRRAGHGIRLERGARSPQTAVWPDSPKPGVTPASCPPPPQTGHQAATPAW